MALTLLSCFVYFVIITNDIIMPAITAKTKNVGKSETIPSETSEEEPPEPPIIILSQASAYEINAE